MGLIVIAGVGAGLSLVYATTGWGIPCPVRGLTGWLCPFCGGTHMGADLLGGDLISAWNDNPALLVALFLLAARGAGWVVEAARGRATRWLPRKVREQAAPIVLIVCAAWMIVRNLI